MENIMNIENLEINRNKIKMFNKEESIEFDSLKNSFANINDLMDLFNNQNLENIQFEIFKKFKVVKKIHSNNAIVLDENINKYVATARAVSQSFDDIKKR